MTNLKKLAAACVLLSSPAWAGEITGNGKPTPISEGVASSSCSFSGRNDDTSGPSDRVQAYGMIRAAFGGPAPFHGIPGTACNGS